MFDISPEKLLVVVVIALAVLGPEGIPRVARGLGKARAAVSRLTADVPPDALQVLTNPRAALADAVSGPGHAVSQAVAEPRSALAEVIAGFKLTAPTPPAAPRLDPTPPTSSELVAGGVPAPDEPGLN